MFNLANQSLSGVTLRVAHGPPNGPTLLLLHGVMRSWRSFAPVWPALLPRHTLAIADHRGHGGSARATTYLVRDYLADAALLVEQLPGPVTIWGHSLGSLVAAGVAAMIPQRVRAVILEDPPSPAFLANVNATPYGAIFRGMQSLATGYRGGCGGPTTFPPSPRIAETGADWKQLAAIPLADGGTLGQTRDAASLRLSAAMLRDLDPATLTPLIAGNWLDGLDWFGILRGVACPVLLLRADDQRGGMLCAAVADDMMKALSDGLRVDFPGVGHQIHWLATEALLRVVLAFLESL